MNTKEKEFKSSQALRESLSQVLKNTTLLQAFEAIKSAPDEFPPQIPGIHYDLILSREHAKTVGTNNAIKRLFDLTRELPSMDELKKETDRPEWMDGAIENLPDFAKEALRKSQEYQKE